jgi:hypothetical protein
MHLEEKYEWQGICVQITEPPTCEASDSGPKLARHVTYNNRYILLIVLTLYNHNAITYMEVAATFRLEAHRVC